MIKKKFLGLVSLLFLTTTSQSASLDRLFLDKNYWAKFNWENIESTELYRDTRLETKEPESNDTKTFYEKFGDVEINGILFKESFIKNNRLTKNNRKINLAFKDEQKIPKNEDTCSTVVSLLEKQFGSNYDITEYTSMFNNTPMLTKKMKYAEWINGKTNIQVVCTQLLRDSFHVSVVYSPNTEENKVKKPIKLTCEREYRLVGSNQSGTARAIHFTVLQDEMDVVNADNNLMGKVEELTNTYIKFSSESDEAKQTYTINRIDGGLSGTYFNTKTNQVTANYNGTCAKRVSEERKF